MRRFELRAPWPKAKNDWARAPTADGSRFVVAISSFPPAPARRSGALLDRNGQPQRARNKTINLNNGQVDFLDVSAVSLGLAFGQRVGNCGRAIGEWQVVGDGNTREGTRGVGGDAHRIAVSLLISSTARNQNVVLLVMYNRSMDKHVIHISKAEAESDFAALWEHVRAGTEVVIEHDAGPFAVVLPPQPAVRLLSESLCLAKKHGSTTTIDDDFAKDVESAIDSHREPLKPPAWD